jgi:hypothetical protein
MALALAGGGQWEAGAYTIEGQTTNATATIGLPFAPLGILSIGRMTAQNTVATSTAQDRVAIGTGDSTTSRRAMGGWSENGNSTAAEIDTVLEYDSVLAFPSASGTLAASVDIDAMTSDGFRVIVDTNGGVTAEWQGFLAWGGKPPHSIPGYLGVRVGDGMGIGSDRLR